MPISRFAPILVVILLALPFSALARTWQVEKDGSGDFRIIQEAVDAAVSGDTIQVGPGRFDDFADFTAPAWTREVIIGVTKNNLTFIGSGFEETIIGPEVMYEPPGLPPMGIACIENYFCEFRDLRVENVYNGIYWAHGRVEVSNCTFFGCPNGVYLFNDGGGLVKDSTFVSTFRQHDGIITFSPCRDILVIDCIFSGLGSGVDFNGTDNAEVSSCQFSCETTAIHFGQGSEGSASNNTAADPTGLGVWVSSNSSAVLTNNTIFGSFSSLYLDSWAHVSGSGNVFSGGPEVGTIFLGGASTATLNGNHILKSGDWAVFLVYYFYELIEQDLTGNFWGTTDPDSISSWIWDYNDDPTIHSVVNFEPFADGPVPAEEKSFGSIKAMFR